MSGNDHQNPEHADDPQDAQDQTLRYQGYPWEQSDQNGPVAPGQAGRAGYPVASDRVGGAGYPGGSGYAGGPGYPGGAGYGGGAGSEAAPVTLAGWVSALSRRRHRGSRTTSAGWPRPAWSRWPPGLPWAG